MNPRFAVLKLFMTLRVYWVLNMFLFFPYFILFLIFHNTVIIYNIAEISDDTTESPKEKRPVLMLIFITVSQKSQD